MARKTISMQSHVQSISLKVQDIGVSVDVLTTGFGMVASQLGNKMVIHSRDERKFPSFVLEAKNTPQKDVAFDDITTVS